MRRVTMPFDLRLAVLVSGELRNSLPGQKQPSNWSIAISLVREIQASNAKLATNQQSRSDETGVPLELHSALSCQRSYESGGAEFSRVIRCLPDRLRERNDARLRKLLDLNRNRDIHPAESDAHVRPQSACKRALLGEYRAERPDSPRHVLDRLSL